MGAETGLRELNDAIGDLVPAAASRHAGSLPRRPVAGRFLLDSKLGEGAFGIVYEAEDLRDGGRVALKMLRDAHPDWLYRFKLEFRALQGFVHRNLVALNELFFDGERWFFTMELLRGVDLATHVRGRPALPEPRLSIESTIRLTGARDAAREPRLERETGTSPGMFDERKLRDALGQLLEGLAVLHAAGKVHRDIKPSNVLATAEGRVVLLDFGLVTDARGSTASALVGTPAYMAPEQAALREVGPAADLYSVGVILYELLTGRAPVGGSPPQILRDKQTHQPPAPSSVGPGVPDDLNALCMSLLHAQPKLRPSAIQALRLLWAAGGAHAEAPRVPTDSSTFVGRGPELSELRKAFALTTQGQLAVVLVTGESGIGKSSLVRRFLSELTADRPDATTLVGRCYEREAVPYKAIDGIVDALSHRLSRMPESEAASLLPARSAALADAFPVMLRIPQVANERVGFSEGAEPHELRKRAFLALRDLFTRLAMRCPTVISIDDLQWADDDGLRALAEVLRLPDAPPLLFIGTVRLARDGESGGGLERVRRAIPVSTPVIELRSLGHDEARELASALLERADAADVDPDRIATEAGGHPLFVEELARHVVLGGPSRDDLRLDDAIASRVAQFDRPTQEIVHLVVVAGGPLAQRVVSGALTSRTMAEAWSEPVDFARSMAILRASNLVRASGSGQSDAIEPYHDRVREAVLARLDEPLRHALHEALAVAFQSSPRPDPEMLAMHWRGAGQRAQAAHYAEAAGEQASRAFAFDRAARWYEQSLELLPAEDAARNALRVKLGEALANAGRAALAAVQFEDAAARSPRPVALDLRRRAAEQLLRSGQFDRALTALRSVLAAVGMGMPATRLGATVMVLFYRVLLTVRGLRFRRASREQIGPAKLTRIDTCWSVCSALTASMVDPVIHVAFATRALLLALEAGDLERIARSVARETALTARAGGRSWPRVTYLLRRANELAEECGTASARAHAAVGGGIALSLVGQFRMAVERLSGALGMLGNGSADFAWERVEVRMLVIRSLAFLGRFGELRRRQREWLRDALDRGDVYAATVFRLGFSTLTWLVDDKPEVAGRNASEAIEEWSKLVSSPTPFLGNLAHQRAKVLLFASLYVGDAEKSYALASEVAARTMKFHTNRLTDLWALYLRAGSALALATRDPARRNALVREARRDARVIAREAMPWSRPFATVLHAGMALLANARPAAIDGFDAAAREFDAADMKAYAAAARDRAARLRDDGSSASEIERAADVLREEGVVAPERMMALLVPGV